MNEQIMAMIKFVNQSQYTMNFNNKNDSLYARSKCIANKTRLHPY